MRPIDADKVKKDFSEVLERDYEDDYAKGFQAALVAVLRYKTISPPPNDPLTMEELREMDGEPVWVVTGSAINAGRGHWDICDWWDKNTVMFPYGGEQPRIDDCGITWTAYRRRPEEGTA